MEKTKEEEAICNICNQALGVPAFRDSLEPSGEVHIMVPRTFSRTGCSKMWPCVWTDEEGQTIISLLLEAGAKSLLFRKIPCFPPPWFSFSSSHNHTCCYCS